LHRLIARKIGRDPSLVEKARVSLGRSAEHFKGYSFIREWNDVLDLPVPRVRQLLTSRDEAMTRLRLSSPFVVTDGIDFEDEALRRRIWRAAKRISFGAYGAIARRHSRIGGIRFAIPEPVPVV
jgi:hypothetical protein